jgi:hypothetical protein
MCAGASRWAAVAVVLTSTFYLDPDFDVGTACARRTPGAAGTAQADDVTSWPEPLAPGSCAPLPPVLLEPNDGSVVRAPRVTLRVHVEDPLQRTLTVRIYGRQVPWLRPPTFTLVALPDTQYYAQTYPDTFMAQTQWIVGHRGFYNIVYVAHLGDIVDECYDLPQWDNANRALSVLDMVPTLPYGLAVGNHDQIPNGNPYGTAIFNSYFPYARYEGVVGWYGGHCGTDNDNHYVLFSAAGLDFIAIQLEYDEMANPAALIWASALLDLYPTRRAIVASHALIGPDANWCQQGIAVYNALKHAPNLFLMLCAHFAGESRRTDVYNGNTVYTLMANYQGRTNGGDGWLRYLQFSPENDSITVSTYSPTLNRFERDADSQFTLPYTMDTTPFVCLGTLPDVPSGSDVALQWVDLPAIARFQWYTVLSNGSDATTGVRWTVSTTWPLGDLNCDGALDFGDINPFVQFLSDFGVWKAAHPDCPATNGDINQDGVYPSFGDINPFVALLTR